MVSASHEFGRPFVPVLSHSICWYADTSAPAAAPCATCRTRISFEAQSIDWEVKYDPSVTTPYAEIILTPDIVSKLGLTCGRQQGPSGPLSGVAVFECNPVFVESPVDSALNVPLVAGVTCEADGTMVERDLPVIGRWGMNKLNCTLQPVNSVDTSSVRLVKASMYNMCCIP